MTTTERDIKQGQTAISLYTVVYICVLLSGTAALIYEVVWSRQLALFLGITTYAHTAVITAYMIGLALGSIVFGRVADKHRNPLRIYAWLEVGIGLYALLTPWLFTWVQSFYGNASQTTSVTGTPAHFVRFALALACLLIPTFMMGGTLPPLVRGLTRKLPDVAASTGRLYGINTLGATLGALAAGYLLLPALGVRATTFVGVALNFIVATTILVFSQRLSRVQSQAKRKENSNKTKSRVAKEDILSPTAARLLLAGFAISGFAALIYQIAWIRALILVIGSSVYSFSITLTVYLAGLGLGSLLYVRLIARRDTEHAAPTSRRLGQAALMETAIAFSAMLGLPLIGLLPRIFLQGYQAGLHESFGLFQAFIFALCFLIMFIPTLLLGALFPLITALWTRDAAAVGRGVGTAYAANTAGTVLGSLLGGLFLLPTLGVHNSLLLATSLHIAVGLLFWFLRPQQPAPRVRFGAAGAILLLFLLVAWLLPPWDRAIMTSGVFVNADRIAEYESSHTVQEKRILYYAEGLDGVVTVEDTGEQLSLVINGKADASSRSDLITQILVGQLPMLTHPDPEDVLVIGLGSGITVGSAATHASAGRIDVLEISEEVAEASQFFNAENGDVLKDPRVNLIVADGRNFALSVDHTYDVIISQPSNPWISGISNLFTAEYFELAKTRLAPGGIMSQWFQTYNMSVEDTKTILETYQSVFPFVTVWSAQPGDLILLGSEEPHALNFKRLQEMLDHWAVRGDLQRINVEDAQHILSTYLFGGETLRSYSAGAPLNSDDRPRIEFNAPRNLYTSTVVENKVNIVSHLAGAEVSVPVTDLALVGENELDVPAFGLTLRSNTPLGADDWRAEWLLQRRRIADAGDFDSLFDERSQGVLVWQNGEHPGRITALFFAGGVNDDLLRWLLGRPLEGRILQTGKLELIDGSDAQWVSAIGEELGDVTLGVSWSCPTSFGGHMVLTAFSDMPKPAAEDFSATLTRFSQQFSCMNEDEA